ncbi:CaiB/BaiF CoA transferase family protein [Novosphingobium pokkalii]|uniref:CaiB/BaiF CoA transferase family protein n=1 Tax=Novosphingobium pokkalii TaxID=1770194 RepID=A0ABV7V798_9SPHN|nr:CoA transferase [Novosphingobium pokkalii]GHC98037.1 CoA transferase [Novosphingobium pokkalii]
MYDVMQGIKVVEVAEHTFVPAAAMILADWGADVIKVERSTGGGDPGRALAIPNSGRDGFNMYFEAGNRGKRSLALDLTQPDGRAILHKLIASADIFITNLRADARAKLGIEASEVMSVNPRIIYARGTGYGLQGRMANDGGFDYPSSWCRSGSAYMQTAPGGEPPMQPGSIGDLGGGAMLAGAISAALFRRERTGRGAIVDNALYLVGIYLMSQSIVAAGMGLERGPNPLRADSFNAIMNVYKTKDDRWISLCLLMEQWWPDLVRHLDRPDLLGDERFKDAAARFANRRALIATFDMLFAQHDFDYWKDKLATLQGVWAPVQSPAEVITDDQALANGFVTEIVAGDGRGYLGGASPAQFDEQPIGILKAAPAYGADGEAILSELGFSTEDVAALKARQIIR